jgi:hypothetical protein
VSNAQPGWYDEVYGRRRWWDGRQWTDHFEQPPVPVAAYVSPRPPAQQWAQQSQWQQQQAPQRQGPRIFLFIPVIWLICFSVSQNHYGHA